MQTRLSNSRSGTPINFDASVQGTFFMFITYGILSCCAMCKNPSHLFQRYLHTHVYIYTCVFICTSDCVCIYGHNVYLSFYLHDGQYTNHWNCGLRLLEQLLRFGIVANRRLLFKTAI